MTTLFAKFVGLKPMAGMHTHPNGTVPSEGDRDYLKNSKLPYEVVIANMGKEFKWFCVDKDLRHVTLYTKDAEIEAAFLLLAGSCGLMDLGRVFVSPDGEILSDSNNARRFLHFDGYAFKVWQALTGYLDGDGKLRYSVKIGRAHV